MKRRRDTYVGQTRTEGGSAAVVLELAGVTMSYGAHRAVNEVDLMLEQGETLAIIGPNGAGKSSLFGVIAGEHTPSSGRKFIFGEDATAWKPSELARCGVSRAFQIAQVFATSTIDENILLAALGREGQAEMPWPFWTRQSHLVDVLEETLSLVAMSDRRKMLAGALSQGGKKQLEIAMAVAQQPRILLLDEPTAGMSLGDARQTVQMIVGIRKKFPQLSILVTAHDMEVIFALAERVLLMAEGSIRVEGSPQQVADNPLTRQLYLGTQS